MTLETFHVNAAIEAIDAQIETLTDTRDTQLDYINFLRIENEKIDHKLDLLEATKSHLSAMTVDTWEETATEAPENLATTVEPGTSPFIPTPPLMPSGELPTREKWEPRKRRIHNIPVSSRCGLCDAYGHVEGVKCAECNGTGRAPWSN